MKISISTISRDNRAIQLNPSHSAYYCSRGGPLDKAHGEAVEHQATQNGYAFSHSKKRGGEK